MDEHGVYVEWHCEGEVEVLGEGPILLLFAN